MPTGITEDATVQLSKLIRLLKILSVLQLFLGILSMFVSIMSGLFVLIGALLLFIITCTKNWCTSVFYVVLTLMDFVECIMLVGNYMAKHSGIESGAGVLLFLMMIKLPFYVIAMYYCFLSYKELKALLLEGLSSSGNMMMQSFGSRDSAPSGPPANPPVQPFLGAGYRLG
jgi:hypothetical protein